MKLLNPLFGLRERARLRRYGPITRDRCDTCGRPLHERERVEVAHIKADSAEGSVGGHAVIAVYCKKDDPRA